MAEFLDGVKQGGGLATVADVTVAGGAVTEVGATVALVDGGVYEFTAIIEQNGAGTSNLGWVFDSNTTGSNYPIYGSVFSRVSSSHLYQGLQTDDTFQYTAGETNAAGVEVACKCRITVSGTTITCEAPVLKVDEAATTPLRYLTGMFTYDSGTLPSEIGVLSSLASGIANGSTIKGVRLY